MYRYAVSSSPNVGATVINLWSKKLLAINRPALQLLDRLKEQLEDPNGEAGSWQKQFADSPTYLHEDTAGKVQTSQMLLARVDDAARAGELTETEMVRAIPLIYDNISHFFLARPSPW